MLAVARQEFLAPGKGLGDVEVHVLRPPQTYQDHGPKHHVENDEARHQPRAQFLVARPGDEARGAAAADRAHARTRGGGQRNRFSHSHCSALSAYLEYSLFFRKDSTTQALASI